MENNLNTNVSTQTTMNQSVVKNTEAGTKDVLVYIGILITLIVSVWNVINVVFEAINKAFPDPLNAYTSVYSFDSLRWSISVLTVIFPIYVIFSRIVARDIEKDISKIKLPIRKFTLFTALFVSGATIVGALIMTIYNFLGGELSSRFTMKALFVVVISLVISSYYYYLTKRDYTTKTITPAIFGFVAVILVLVSVIWSISVVGSPSQVRSQKIDDQRSSDLMNIGNYILESYKKSYHLPTNITEVAKVIPTYAGSRNIVLDPSTNEEYQYKVINIGNTEVNPQMAGYYKYLSTPAVFELCANFETNSNDYQSQGYSSSVFYDHIIGRNCYLGTIDNDVLNGRNYTFITKE